MKTRVADPHIQFGKHIARAVFAIRGNPSVAIVREAELALLVALEFETWQQQSENVVDLAEVARRAGA
jgi:hypothetical protein